MKLLLRSLFLFAAALHAQTTPPPKYAVLKTENGDSHFTRINQLADQGYRVLIVNNYTVLRLEAVPPDTYRYLRIEVKGGPAQFGNWINDQGAHGYRWLDRTGLLEKAPHPHNYEYRTADHAKYHAPRTEDLSAMVEKGYRPLAPIAFEQPLGQPTGEDFFERDLDQAAPPEVRYSGTAIAIAAGGRATTVMKRVNELAQKGYRFDGPHGIQRIDYMTMMMEKCPKECSGRYEYRFFDAKNQEQVEHDLNALGHDGFRVVPSALNGRPHLLERDTRAKQSFLYRALNPIDAADLAQQLNAAEGFAPVDFVWHRGFATAQGFLILEKEITAAASP